MTQGICPCPTRSSLLHRLPLIGQGVALRRQSTVSGRAQRQVMQRRQPVTGHGWDRAAQRACQSIALNQTPRIQTP
jgi:hypothetical protein